MSRDYANFATMYIALRDRDEFYVEKILAHHGGILVDLRFWASMLNGGALMNLLTLEEFA
jgi:hypothetical protein